MEIFVSPIWNSRSSCCPCRRCRERRRPSYSRRGPCSPGRAGPAYTRRRASCPTGRDRTSRSCRGRPDDRGRPHGDGVADRLVDGAGCHVRRYRYRCSVGRCRWPQRCPRTSRGAGRMTAASLGPSLAAPVRGLTTLPPWTSWSYWRTTDSLLQMFSRPSICFRACRMSVGPGIRVPRGAGGSHAALRFIWGRPSWRKSISQIGDGLPRHSGHGTYPYR